MFGIDLRITMTPLRPTDQGNQLLMAIDEDMPLPSTILFEWLWLTTNGYDPLQITTNVYKSLWVPMTDFIKIGQESLRLATNHYDWLWITMIVYESQRLTKIYDDWLRITTNVYES